MGFRATQSLLRLAVTVIFVFVIGLPSAEVGFAKGRRVALVMGNSSYENTAPLENPKNDATDFAARLKELGFEVVLGVGLDKARMDKLFETSRMR